MQYVQKTMETVYTECARGQQLCVTCGVCLCEKEKVTHSGSSAKEWQIGVRLFAEQETRCYRLLLNKRAYGIRLRSETEIS